MSRILKSNDTIITQNFKGIGVHGGVDVVGSNHSLCPVLAHSSGTVEMVSTGHSNNPNATGDATYGNFVKIKHSNNYSTLYAHLDKVYVSKGQTVTKNQEIGYMGNTGRSFGGHLHFEVRKDGSYNSIINPEPYINADLPGLTSNGLISQWQTVMNNIYHCNLAVDNSYGPDSKAKANQYQLHYTVPTMKNEYVRFVQQRLNDLGYKVAIDGSFGPDMNEKIRKFQQDRGLKVDGWVGKDTVYELLKDSSIVSSSGIVLKNDRVLEWQKVMNQVYRCNLALDGSFGPDSKAKANQYQLHYTVPTMKNEYVRFVQQRLNDLGYKVAIDGSFGPDMNEKIRKFQQDRGLKVDGWVGKDTVEQLLK